MTNLDAPGIRRRLTGWGGTAPSVARVARPASPEALATLVANPTARGTTARGLGRAYGDAAQNGGGLVLDCTGLDAIGAIEVRDGGATITVGGGASLDTILQVLLTAGWCLPVLPGTRQVTVGGAIAADVHGKNHHRLGAFGAHVEAFTLHTATGERRVVTHASDAALFAATTGGMGLTGVVVDATLRLVPVETRLMRVATEHTPDLDATMRALVEADAGHAYTVAWLDLVSGRGRGIVGAADHATRAEATESCLDAPPRTLRLAVPPVVPVSLVNRATVRLFNAAWFRRPVPREVLQPIESYLAPLDALGAWPRLYGPRGLLQYQCALPTGEEPALRAIVEAISRAPAVPALAVLKRFGPGMAAPLSFPIEGWTLAVDFPAGDAALGAFLDTLDVRVAAAGGRVYLAKDARMRSEMVPLMYPRLDEWRETQARVDPHGLFTSDLNRRLRLTRGAGA